MMSENKYLVRAPLLDPAQHVLGYKLAWQKDENATDAADEADLGRLLAFVAAHAGSRLGMLFVQADPAPLSDKTLQAMQPGSTVLTLKRSDLADDRLLRLAASWRERGGGVSLRDADFAWLTSNPAPTSFLTQVEVPIDHPDLPAIARLARQEASAFSMVVSEFRDWKGFEACAALGVNGFFPNLCLVPREVDPPGEIGPQASLILQLMQMVQENADVRELEKVLKRDATISYKLFRYINSAGFGIEVEIQSLRHAVAMLGYRPLFRWLSLLLGATSSAGFSPALLQAAIVRGHFTELLGRGSLPKGEAENLFFVGMFSLLDQLLGIPIQEVLSRIVLPEAVAQALLTRDGAYGPLLALAETCEKMEGCAAVHADALFMTPAEVNQAHMSALAWAQSIQL